MKPSSNKASKSNTQLSSSSIGKKTNPSKNSATIIPSFHHYQNLTNEQYLLHCIRLLGITESEYQKEAKLSLNDPFFTKNQQATTTKTFFYITFKAMEILCSEQQFEQIKMWYPPRNVNEQLQYKRVLYALILRLEGTGKLPKKILISKTFLMGDVPSEKIISFLRILTEIALRQLYIDKFSKENRLIQIPFDSSFESEENHDNDINKFYCYPFVPSNDSNPTMTEQELISLKRIYQTHIEIYRKKILSLGSKYPKQQNVMCAQLMQNLMEQKQLNQKLTKKIPEEVLSQNRSFDRRQLLDKSKLVWEQLNNLQCNFIEESHQTPVLKTQGQIDKILLKWQTSSGINKVLDANNLMKSQTESLKQKCAQKISEFKEIEAKMTHILDSYNS